MSEDDRIVYDLSGEDVDVIVADADGGLVSASYGEFDNPKDDFALEIGAKTEDNERYTWLYIPEDGAWEIWNLLSKRFGVGR